MELYLVGGAVRDFLLGRLNDDFSSELDEKAYWDKVEKDWVVVGSTPDEMLQKGYRPVGKSFPVFLHKDTQEEYALARVERKTGKGYTGFECYAGQNVTLQEDLKRRDLTINAIAAPLDYRHITFDNIIDPYHGLDDLKNKIFRHVSEAFAEDPVRILRVARLACRFNDFHVHKTTLELMKEMVQNGEVNALIPERVWQEWSRSLKEKSPWRFFEILNDCGALEVLFHEIHFSPSKKQMLEQAVKDGVDDPIKLAIEIGDIKEKSLRDLIARFRIPNEFGELALLTAQNYSLLSKDILTPEEILSLFEKTDAFRRTERFHQFLTTCNYLGRESINKERHLKLKTILSTLKGIDNQALLDQGLTGKDFAIALRKLRLEKLKIS